MADLRRAVPVLTYHSIDGSGSPVSVAAPEFARQMQALAGGGWTSLPLDAFMQGLRGAGWPARTFLLTFDDGYRNLLDEALPVTSALGFTGIVFVATDRVGARMSGDGGPAWTPDSPLLDWDGLRDVASAGWTIGSHARSHRALPSLPADDVARELTGAKAAIEHKIGAPVTSFAYPYGASSAAVERIAADHYDACFGTTLAWVTPASRRARLERLDACYLRGMPIGELDGAPLGAYLALRRAGRAVRAMLRRQ